MSQNATRLTVGGPPYVHTTYICMYIGMFLFRSIRAVGFLYGFIINMQSARSNFNDVCTYVYMYKYVQVGM